MTRASLMAAVLVLSGCASFAPDARFTPVEDAVARMRPGDVPPLCPHGGNRRFDDGLLLCPELPPFTGMRIQTKNCNPWFINRKILLQRLCNNSQF